MLSACAVQEKCNSPLDRGEVGLHDYCNDYVMALPHIIYSVKFNEVHNPPRLCHVAPARRVLLQLIGERNRTTGTNFLTGERELVVP